MKVNKIGIHLSAHFINIEENNFKELLDPKYKERAVFLIEEVKWMDLKKTGFITNYYFGFKYKGQVLTTKLILMGKK